MLSRDRVRRGGNYPETGGFSRRSWLNLALTLPSCSAQQGDWRQPQRAAMASDFSLRDTTGKTVRLSDYLGQRVILLSFWTTWCGPCAVELPQLQRLYTVHAAAGLMVLAISMDGPETLAEVAPRARRYGLEFPVLLDEETRVVRSYNPKRAAPYTVLIDRQGSIVAAREGYATGDDVKLERQIEALLRAHG